MKYQHINFPKAVSFLGNKVALAAPKKFIAWVTARWHAKNTSADQGFDIIDLLQPQQIVPCSESQELRITWIGHATFLIQVDGFNILTDPIFDAIKAGPLTLSRRAMPAGIRLEDLPPIDAILISHNHSDHTDTNSLQAIAKRYNPVVYVPEGNKELLASMGFSHVVEATWWDKKVLHKQGKTMQMTCLPALHWSIRFSLQSYRKSLWSSWMVSSADTNIYFAGDTAYGEHFKQIGNEFPAIDIALLPIGTRKNGDAHGQYCHTDAAEAVDACIDLKARCFIPMHYGTFWLAKRVVSYPLLDILSESWNKKKDQLAEANLLIARCGKTYAFDKGTPRDYSSK